jgi:hypothetical protein
MHTVPVLELARKAAGCGCSTPRLDWRTPEPPFCLTAYQHTAPATVLNTASWRIRIKGIGLHEVSCQIVERLAALNYSNSRHYSPTVADRPPCIPLRMPGGSTVNASYVVGFASFW